MIERHNETVGYTVTKTMKNGGWELELVLQSLLPAKKSLKYVNGFSTNQLVFERNPNFPTALKSELPALEGKSCNEVVANNINAMCCK